MLFRGAPYAGPRANQKNLLFHHNHRFAAVAVPGRIVQSRCKQQHYPQQLERTDAAFQQGQIDLIGDRRQQACGPKAQGCAAKQQRPARHCRWKPIIPTFHAISLSAVLKACFFAGRCLHLFVFGARRVLGLKTDSITIWGPLLHRCPSDLAHPVGRRQIRFFLKVLHVPLPPAVLFGPARPQRPTEHQPRRTGPRA